LSRRLDVLSGVHFVQGDIACAEGAIAAGCRFFAGYPITPSSEIAQRMAVRLPQVGGIYLQMEDEIASIAAVIGASWAGLKAMTATSGPGFSLMQENIGYAYMTETPCVIVDVMRGGPSTGQPTKPGQQDVMQAKWGSHGDYEVIALSPASVQEMFDLTIEAFNLSETYRCPVILLADEVIGHLREKLIIPEPDEIEVVERRRPEDVEGYKPFKPGENLVPPMARLGEGFRLYITGLTHDETGRPRASSPEAQERLVRRLCDKIRLNRDRIARFEEHHLEDAEIVVIAYGLPYRSALPAVEEARRRGIRAGLYRPITLWPQAEGRLREIGERAHRVIVLEMNYGQMLREYQRWIDPDRIVFSPSFGDAIPTPEGVLSLIKRCMR